MEEYKAKFIDFLLKTGALRVGGDYTLKSKRISPWFVNVGDFNDGESSTALGEYYADSILSSGIDFDLLYGIPEKGNALAVATAIGLNKKGKNAPWFFTRKVAKEYGEATNLSQVERIKALVVGRAPKNGQTIIQLDDVFTAGDAKYEARAVLQSLGDFNLPLLAIAVDRQEVGIDGKGAIEEYEQKTGTRVTSIVNALDVYNYLKASELLPKVRQELSETKTNLAELEERLKTSPEDEGIKGDIAHLRTYKERLEKTEKSLTPENIERMSTYLRVYGTDSARKAFGKLEQRIIERDSSVLPACDVSFEEFEPLVRDTADVPGIGGYKIPARAGRKGWERWVEVARKYTDKPLIHDGQKWGTDIPDTGKEIMNDLKESGFDAVILFPQSGPETERAWIYHALDKGLKVIVGGPMTHPGYKESEGGFLSDEGVFRMIRIAARAGINNFVVPGTKLDDFKRVTEIIKEEGVQNPVFYAPGFVAQGGKIEEATKVAGDRWHAIVGRGIYQAADKRKAAIEYCSQLK